MLGSVVLLLSLHHQAEPVFEEASTGRASGQEAASEGTDPAPFESATPPVVASTFVLELTAGDAVFVDAEIPAPRRHRGRVRFAIANPSSTNPEIELLPWPDPLIGAEPVRTSAGVRAWRVRYAIRVAPHAERGGHVEGRVEAVVPATGRTVARTTIAHDVALVRTTGASAKTRTIDETSTKVSPNGSPEVSANSPAGVSSSASTSASTSASSGVSTSPTSVELSKIDLWRRALDHHRAEARGLRERLPMLLDILPVDGAPRTLPWPRVPESALETLTRFLHHSLAADFARAKLRAAAESIDDPVATRAALTLGQLDPRAPPIRQSRTAEIREVRDLEAALAQTLRSIEEFRLADVEDALERLRNSGRLTPVQLATTLVYQGALASLRDRPSEATQAFGQALSLHPDLPNPFRGQFLRKKFDAAQRVQRPGGPITIERVEARRTEDGREFEIAVRYRGDAFGLAVGGDVHIWGTGGAEHSAKTARTDTAQQALWVRIPASAEILNYQNQLLLKAFLRDVSGVVLARFGDPDPQPVATVEIDGVGGGQADFPWWIVAVAGGLVVVASATAGIAVLAGHGDQRRGIGPIDVAF